MKNYFSVLFIPVFIFTGCQKTLLNKAEVGADNINPDNFYEVDINSEIVTMLSSLPLNDKVCSEVANIVEQSVSYGLDEDFMFRELWAPETKVSSAHHSLLKLQIDGYLMSNISTKSGSCTIDTILKNSDISIYWPYCEDWDGKTLPTITCPPTDENQEWNYGYKLREVNGKKSEAVRNC